MSRRSSSSLKVKLLAFVLLSGCCLGALLSHSWFVSPAIAQTVQDRKAEGDRLLGQGNQ